MTEDKNKFTYMMLSRLESDCKYFLGNGNRNDDCLWGLNVNDHIQEMKNLYDKLGYEEKPEWLTVEDILNYEKQMKEGR